MADKRQGLVGLAACGGALAVCITAIIASTGLAAAFNMATPAWLMLAFSLAAAVAFFGAAKSVIDLVRRVEAASQVLSTDALARDSVREPAGDLLSEARSAKDQIARYRLEVERLQDIDPVTGLGNRKWLQIRTVQELSRARREGTPLSFILIAIDQYDEIAERLGSSASEALQLHVADTLKSFVRPYDAVARISASEFGVLTPGAAAPTATSMVQRLKGAVMASPPLLLGGEMPDIRVVSVERQPDETLFDELLGRARGMHNARSQNAENN